MMSSSTCPIFGSGCRFLYGKVHRMKWEYLGAQHHVHKEVDGELMDEEMQARGKDGWELVSASERAVSSPDNQQEAQLFTLFFKRPPQKSN